MCSSFLEQKQQNAFLQMSNPEKSNFLSSLVFTNENDSSKIINAVSMEINRTESIVKQNNAILESYRFRISKRYFKS